MTGPCWADGPLCAFDVETPSPDPMTARLVTATVVRVWPGEQPVIRDWLVAVDEDIPADATEVHGITTEHARQHGRPLAEVCEEVSDELTGAWDLRMPVIGFNVCYDLTVLSCERLRLGLPALRLSSRYTPVVDPLVCDRHVDRYRPGKRTLEATCAHYGVTLAGAHTSSGDALAAARVAWRMARCYPELGAMGLAELHEAQARWHAESQRSFAHYLRTTIAAKVRTEAAGLTGDEQAAKLAEVDGLYARADQVDRTADGWPLRGAA